MMTGIDSSLILGAGIGHIPLAADDHLQIHVPKGQDARVSGVRTANLDQGMAAVSQGGVTHR